MPPLIGNGPTRIHTAVVLKSSVSLVPHRTGDPSDCHMPHHKQNLTPILGHDHAVTQMGHTPPKVRTVHAPNARNILRPGASLDKTRSPSALLAVPGHIRLDSPWPFHQQQRERILPNRFTTQPRFAHTPRRSSRLTQGRTPRIHDVKLPLPHSHGYHCLSFGSTGQTTLHR